MTWGHSRFPGYARPLFAPARYKVLYGGRGSAKSYTIARALLTIGAQRKIRVLCGREFQNSIAESVHKLLCEQYEEIGLGSFYTHTRESISGANGTEFIFKGVRNNVISIKSMFGLTHLWLEEAQAISKASWDVLIPTIREPESEIWVSFNPDKEDDPTYQMFVNPDGTPQKLPGAVILNANWEANPWFPKVLQLEKDRLYAKSPELAEHVWGGKCRTNSASQIFRGLYSVRPFDISGSWDGPYFGCDWGFAVDPTVLTKSYVDIPNRRLYVRDARFGYGIAPDQVPALFDKVSGSRESLIRADSARPETINYVSRCGFAIEGVEKWSGSVEDGIDWLKTFDEIVVHPECEQEFLSEDGEKFRYGLVTEFKNYSYKVDRLTGDVRRDIIDAYNHGIDSLRYSLSPMIQAGAISILDVNYKCTEAFS